MRKIGILITIIISLLTGCDETNTSVYTFSKDKFTKPMTDSMVIFVESNGSQIEMKGDLNLSKGKCTISLKVPSGDSISVDTTYVHDTLFSIESIHQRIIHSPFDSIIKYDTIYAIDSIFIADTIFTNDTIIKYKFIYNQSFNDSNTYTIDEKFDRILGKWTFIYKTEKIDAVDPDGSFNFVLKYND
jgi:hypothetical protein